MKQNQLFFLILCLAVVAFVLALFSSDLSENFRGRGGRRGYGWRGRNWGGYGRRWGGWGPRYYPSSYNVPYWWNIWPFSYISPYSTYYYY